MVVEITVCRIKKDCEEKAQRICEQVHAFVVSQTGCVRKAGKTPLEGLAEEVFRGAFA